MLLGNLSDLHKMFLTKYPDEKVSLSAFSILRPPQCILAGPKGTHNVCVCKTHENMRQKFVGLKNELTLKKVEFKNSYRDYFKIINCDEPNSICFLRKCSQCPRGIEVFGELKSTLQKADVRTITFSQWVTTDRFGNNIIACKIF